MTDDASAVCTSGFFHALFAQVAALLALSGTGGRGFSEMVNKLVFAPAMNGCTGVCFLFGFFRGSNMK